MDVNIDAEIEKTILKKLLEKDHLFFTRYFFYQKNLKKFKVNWHHYLISDKLQKVIDGKIENLLINISPGSGKTEMVVRNFIARSLAINPRCRFMNLSGSDNLALSNSIDAKEIVRSKEFQSFWQMEIGTDSARQWNVIKDGKVAGSMYSASLGGQITGFRAGHMDDGFNGAIIIDDPTKADASPVEIENANRVLINTVKSRRARPDVPYIVVMQRLCPGDTTDFILNGNLGGNWDHVTIPALLTKEYIASLEPKYQQIIAKQKFEEDDQGRVCYWPEKERISELLEMEKGGGVLKEGEMISRQTFYAQYMQNPIISGGNIIKTHAFKYYSVLPKIRHRKIFADTAQKKKEVNDFSVLQCWGYGDDGKAYLIDLIRGKWEMPELIQRTKSFWLKHNALDYEKFGVLRGIWMEDKASGTGVIQILKSGVDAIPIIPVQRGTDKLSRVHDILPYIDSGRVALPENAEFLSDFIAECESFTGVKSSEKDDQVDAMCDAIMELIAVNSSLAVWEALGTD